MAVLPWLVESLSAGTWPGAPKLQPLTGEPLVQCGNETPYVAGFYFDLGNTVGVSPQGSREVHLGHLSSLSLAG